MRRTGRVTGKTVFFIFLMVMILALIVPYVISVSNSVLSVDDFFIRIGLKDLSVGESWNRAIEDWHTWGGGVPIMFVQNLLQPLRFGPSYDTPVGVFLVITFLLFVLAVFCLVRNVWSRVFAIRQKWVIALVFFILLLSVLNSDLYPEVYTWYVGNSYLWGYILILFLMAAAISFLDSGRSVWKCVGLSLFGFIACFSYQLDLWAGLTYVLVWYVKVFREKKKIEVYYVIPLVFMIVGGCLSAFAPGNFSRQRWNDSSGLHIDQALIDSLKNIAKCVISLIKNPVCLFSMAAMFFMGVNSDQAKKRMHPLVLWVAGFLAIWGISFPLALGYSSSYVPNRQFFTFNTTIILIGGCCLYYTGVYLGELIKKRNWIRRSLMIVSVAAVIGIPSLFHTEVREIPWVKVVNSIENVKKERVFYNGLLRELEESTGREVEVIRKRNEAPAISGVIKPTFDVWDPGNWINGTLLGWFEKDRITITLVD